MSEHEVSDFQRSPRALCFCLKVQRTELTGVLCTYNSYKKYSTDNEPRLEEDVERGGVTRKFHKDHKPRVDLRSRKI
jgi:hypothetical protein